jgi:predicted RNase H-like nuclease (RuvC/YqgF family)
MFDILWHLENLYPPQQAATPQQNMDISIQQPIENDSINPVHIEQVISEFSGAFGMLEDQRKKQEDMHETIKSLQHDNGELRKNVSELKRTIKNLKLHVENQNDRKLDELEGCLDALKSKFDDRENEEVEEVDDEEEPGIALEDQLRITEQSAKAIDLLSNHQLSTVWQPCSKNTFGEKIWSLSS